MDHYGVDYKIWNSNVNYLRYVYAFVGEFLISDLIDPISTLSWWRHQMETFSA